jgi:hypothetical protein
MSLIDKLKEAQEKRRKAIPSQVFFNHFFAVSYPRYRTNPFVWFV